MFNIIVRTCKNYEVFCKNYDFPATEDGSMIACEPVSIAKAVAPSNPVISRMANRTVINLFALFIDCLLSCVILFFV